MSGVRVEDRGAVRILTLDRPEARNALGRAERRALRDALARAGEESRAIVLAGAGPVFCAGGDLRTMSQERSVARARLAEVGDLVRELIAGERSVVAAVEGGAYGLGLALALACDVVVAGRSARFCTAFAKVGLAPDTALAYTLPLRVGRGRALDLLLTARTVGAEEGERIGLVETVVDDGAALERALAIATSIADLSPAMVTGTRRILAQADRSLDGVLAAEADLQVELLAGDQFAERRAAFLEHRRPEIVGG